MMFIGIDLPFAKDYIAAEERRLARSLTNEEQAAYIAAEFPCTLERAELIVRALSAWEQGLDAS